MGVYFQVEEIGVGLLKDGDFWSKVRRSWGSEALGFQEEENLRGNNHYNSLKARQREQGGEYRKRS